jgi:serine/threonine protein kinase
VLTVLELAAIPGFVPDHELGHGGQGLACLGRLDGEEVVVKVLDPTFFNAIAWKHAQEASRIRHDNVIAILAADVIDIAGVVYHYVVMPCVHGMTLANQLDAGQPFTLDEALRRGAELADGLGAFHAHHQVHRDVKPENIMMPADGRGLVLIDLELVRYEDFPTVTGRWMMTAGYASPEQSKSNVAENRSDLFCLGVVVYQMISGRHPFAAPTAPEVQARIDDSKGMADPLPASVPSEVAQLLRRLLAHEIFGRPASAEEVAATLRAALPARRFLGDIAMGLRVSSAKTIADWCCDEGEELDLVVANASSKTANASFAGLRPLRGRLLIDPNTDMFAANQLRPRFPESVRAWGWEPLPLKDALQTSIDDAKLTRSILKWQDEHGADGLISPYLRLDRWTTTPGEDLVRTAEIAREATRIARASWPTKPLFVGVAVPYAVFMNGVQRPAILTTLTGLDPKPDGVYYVLQDGPITAEFLAALRHTGNTLKAAGLTTILAYAGPELVPLLASGSWDIAVTGASASARHPAFKLQLWGPARRDRKHWLLVTRLLEDLKEQALDRVIDLDPNLILCGCPACQKLLAGGTLAYDLDLAAQHYVAAVNRTVRGLRRLDPAVRAAEQRKDLKDAIARADKIDQAPPAGSVKLFQKPRLDVWVDKLLM